MKEAQLLSPLSECHSCFLEEETLNRPLACAAVLTKFPQCFFVRSICEHCFCHSQRSCIRGLRQLERDRFDYLQLIDDDFDNPSLPRNSLIQTLDERGVNP
jgi:hypothetical protein